MSVFISVCFLSWAAIWGPRPFTCPGPRELLIRHCRRLLVAGPRQKSAESIWKSKRQNIASKNADLASLTCLRFESQSFHPKENRVTARPTASQTPTGLCNSSNRSSCTVLGRKNCIHLSSHFSRHQPLSVAYAVRTSKGKKRKVTQASQGSTLSGVFHNSTTNSQT